jgi:hypothetical protein
MSTPSFVILLPLAKTTNEKRRSTEVVALNKRTYRAEENDVEETGGTDADQVNDESVQQGFKACSR